MIYFNDYIIRNQIWSSLIHFDQFWTDLIPFDKKNENRKSDDIFQWLFHQKLKMWKKWKIWWKMSGKSQKSILRAFARTRAKKVRIAVCSWMRKLWQFLLILGHFWWFCPLKNSFDFWKFNRHTYTDHLEYKTVIVLPLRFLKRSSNFGTMWCLEHSVSSYYWYPII
jgi:hypothetical protein